jgi:hypothetical protein
VGVEYSHITDVCCGLDEPDLRADFFEGRAKSLAPMICGDVGLALPRHLAAPISSGSVA